MLKNTSRKIWFFKNICLRETLPAMNCIVNKVNGFLSYPAEGSLPTALLYGYKTKKGNPKVAYNGIVSDVTSQDTIVRLVPICSDSRLNFYQDLERTFSTTYTSSVTCSNTLSIDIHVAFWRWTIILHDVRRDYSA